MPVYVVNAYDIHDPETFKEYPPRVAPLLQKHGAILLAMDTEAKALEGKPKKMNAIVDFHRKKLYIIFILTRNINPSFI